MRLHETAHRHRVTPRDAAPDVREIGLPLPHARVAIRGLEDERRVRLMIVKLMPVEARSAPARRRPLHRVERNARLLKLPRRPGKHLRRGVGHETKRVVITQRVSGVVRHRWCVRSARGLALRGGRGRGGGLRQRRRWRRGKVGVGFWSRGFLEQAGHFIDRLRSRGRRGGRRGRPHVERLHLLPRSLAEIRRRQFLRAQIIAEFHHASLAVNDVLLREHADPSTHSAHDSRAPTA